jgi:hypothetical protein
MNESSSTVRPRDFALLLLAGSDTAPRRRARDQQADRAGLTLKRRMLEELVCLDPEPHVLESAMLTIVEQFGPPFGPTRSVAQLLLEEWRLACASPQWLDYLIESAMAPNQPEELRHGGQLPG